MISRPLPTPPKLFRLFENGELTREQLHAAMEMHVRPLIEEMEDAHLHPATALFETFLNRRAAARLLRRHHEAVVREILAALAEVPDFPPSNLLWNAQHREVPLHCFLRMRREPVFRVLKLAAHQTSAEISVEHGTAGRGQATREEFILKRDWRGDLVVKDRTTVS